jgi:hypothetical protein
VAGPGGEVPVNWTERTLERAGAADGAAARPLERPGSHRMVPPEGKGALDNCKCVKGGIDPECERHTTGEWRA